MTHPHLRVEATRVVIETLVKLGHEPMLDYLTIEWKPRFTSRLGDARWRRQRGRREARIRFSIPLWERASEQERYETAVHEACHLVQYAEHYAHNRDRDRRGLSRVRIRPHGPEWAQLMRRCGVEPKRLHHVSTKGVKGSKRTVEAKCACQERMLTKRMAARIAAGEYRYCLKCKGQVVLIGQPTPSPPVPVNNHRHRQRQRRRRQGIAGLEDLFRFP